MRPLEPPRAELWLCLAAHVCTRMVWPCASTRQHVAFALPYSWEQKETEGRTNQRCATRRRRAGGTRRANGGQNGVGSEGKRQTFQGEERVGLPHMLGRKTCRFLEEEVPLLAAFYPSFLSFFSFLSFSLFRALNTICSECCTATTATTATRKQRYSTTHRRSSSAYNSSVHRAQQLAFHPRFSSQIVHESAWP